MADDRRRQALIGRFRAGALDRIARIRAELADLVGGKAGGPAEILRELHTLKGESKMLGFAELGDLSHALEEVLGRPGLDQRLSAVAPAAVVVLEEAATYLRGGGIEAARIAELAAAVRSGGVIAGPEREPEPAPEPAAPPSGRPEGRWVQLSSARVDIVCERLSELEAEFRGLAVQLAAALASQAGRGAPPTRARRAVVEQVARCRSLLDETSDAAWSLRLVEVEPSLRDLAVHAHELAAQLGKTVQVTLRAGGSEMERSVLDELREPLLHLVRNAIDHGIQGEGRLELGAEPTETGVAITVIDDGRGVAIGDIRAVAVARGLVQNAAELTDAQALDLLFVHGFSTRATVSSVSGRGIGLDAVRAKVEALGGAVRLESSPGQGTQVTLDVPAMIAKERALVVSVGEALFGLPSRWVREVRNVREVDIVDVAGGRALRRDDTLIPLRSLSAVLGAPQPAEMWLLLLRAGGRSWAFLAPEVLGEFDLLRRPVDPFVAQIGPIAASSVLDDGRIVLLLRPGGLLHPGRERAAVPPRAAPSPVGRVLVVDDSPVVRDLVVSLLEAAGLEVGSADAGESGLRAIEEGGFDLVLCDIEMPGIDGLELLRRIRLRSDHLPVVMLTTRGSAEDRRRAAELGADAYLVKSEFQERTLLDTVRRFLSGGQAVRR